MFLLARRIWISLKRVWKDCSIIIVTDSINRYNQNLINIFDDSLNSHSHWVHIEHTLFTSVGEKILQSGINGTNNGLVCEMKSRTHLMKFCFISAWLVAQHRQNDGNARSEKDCEVSSESHSHQKTLRCVADLLPRRMHGRWVFEKYSLTVAEID